VFNSQFQTFAEHIYWETDGIGEGNLAAVSEEVEKICNGNQQPNRCVEHVIFSWASEFHTWET